MNIYISDVASFLDLSGLELLTTSRQERIRRYIKREDKARCLVAGLLLRKVFGSQAAQNIIESEFGKPFLPNGVHFNLSHSGNAVVLAVNKHQIGVDVELIAPFSMAVAKKVFSPLELKWLTEQASDEAFFRLWTGKESIMKALGLGLQLPPESFEILPDKAISNCVLGKTFFLQWKKLDNYMLCCAFQKPTKLSKIIRLAKKDLLK